MDVTKLEINQTEAAKLHADYRSQLHYETDVDREIRQIYAAIAKGKTIIQGAASVLAVGVNEEGLPKLALAKATAPAAILCIEGHYGDQDRRPERMVRMSHTMRGAQGQTRHERFAWLQSGWLGLRDCKYPEIFRAPMPLIPVHLRPKVALDAYHVLWEAEWRRVVPKDPYLLRRIGKTDFFLVCAAWDLTEVERAVLQSRIAPN